MYKDLRSKRNFDVLPKVIVDVFSEHKFFSGIIHTISGDNLEFPYPMDYSIKFNKQIEDGILFNSDFIKIENPYPYYLEYYNGFKDGYSNFNNLILDTNSIFNSTDTEKAFKVYCKAIEKINFQFSYGYDSKKLEGKNLMNEYYKRYKNGEKIFFCYEDVFFETGKRTGIFYRAWEIILTNSTFFEPLFQKYNENKNDVKETEAIVLNNTSIREKYLGEPTNDNANAFFDFLIEYYRPEDKTQIKYVNILYYLKNDADKIHFIFKVKQDKFRTLVQSKTGIEISKFEKSAKYIKEEKPIFHTLENTFLKKMKV